MTLNAVPHDRQFALAPLDEKVDHVRGSPAPPDHRVRRLRVPYSRQAFHAIEQTRRSPVAMSLTIFWAPMTRITCPAPDTSGPSWLPLVEAMSR